ncbi:MAG: beta-N-acetylhexosaminidase [Gammaproteobacteria bacterium]|nr:beta-N-acetylhexosaminidase [Gammaproteobacteria bacterium]
MSLGPVMIDLAGTALAPEDRELLRHPLVGGVILFSRNYESPEQLAALAAEVHALRTPPLLVTVDHEGGRVQRFRDGFAPLPAAARYGEVYDRSPATALRLAETGGWLMAAELRAVGVDLSFAPVLDLNRGVSHVIGDRAFHARPEVVADLARAFMRGMQRAGMAAVGKHFPGHGSVAADSHDALPVDPRPLADIRAEDLLTFERMVRFGLPAIMPAHVVFPAVDDRPAGFSRTWIEGILRGQLGFQGAVVSDDLSMAGATFVADRGERAKAALDAGCDLLLVCHDRQGVDQVLRALADYRNPVSQARLARLHGRGHVTRAELLASAGWRDAATLVARLEREPELALGDDGLA